MTRRELKNTTKEKPKGGKKRRKETNKLRSRLGATDEGGSADLRAEGGEDYLRRQSKSRRYGAGSQVRSRLGEKACSGRWTRMCDAVNTETRK